MLEQPSPPQAEHQFEEINFIADRFDEIFTDTEDLRNTITGDHKAAANPLGVRGTRNTDLMLERMSAARDYTPPVPGDTDAPYGRFRGRQIVGSKARIDKGIYLGRTAREAPTVDAHSPAMNALHAELLEERADAHLAAWTKKEPPQNNLVFQAFNLVYKKLPYSEHIDRVIRRAHDIKNNPDAEISVDKYLAAGGGVCRHQVLVLGALLERLIAEGKVPGQISAERNYIPNILSHAWLEYTEPSGAVWILDLAQSVYIEKSRLPDYAKFVYGINE